MTHEVVPATAHHFCAGVYAKEMHIPKGHCATMHRHAYDHMSILGKGKVYVTIGSSAHMYTAPAVVEIKAGVVHGIQAIEDSIWYCIHPTEATDPSQVDEVAIAK